jgi:RNA cap guanine-N2 methyltransferase
VVIPNLEWIVGLLRIHRTSFRERGLFRVGLEEVYQRGTLAFLLGVGENRRRGGVLGVSLRNVLLSHEFIESAPLFRGLVDLYLYAFRSLFREDPEKRGTRHLGQKKKTVMENPGIDPGTSRMLSERSTSELVPLDGRSTNQPSLCGGSGVSIQRSGTLKLFVLMRGRTSAESFCIYRQMGPWRVVDRTIVENRSLKNYFYKKDALFPQTPSNGLLVDTESWYSITPRDLADAITRLVRRNIRGRVSIVDGFCGVGGNTLSFLAHGFHVTSVDLDYTKIKYLRHNIKEVLGEGVHREMSGKGQIELVHEDLFRFLDRKASTCDILFIAPPWGGPAYKTLGKYGRDLCRIGEIERKGKEMSRSRVFFLPRTMDTEGIEEDMGKCKVIRATSKGRLAGILLVTGEMASRRLPDQI